MIALVVAGAPPAGLGERAAAVHEVLVARTLAVARGAAARVEVAATVAAALALAEPGPLLVLPAICPRIAGAHVAAAVADLGAGCDAVYGPTLEGDWYLAGLREPRPDLLDLAALRSGGIGAVLEQARAHDASVGLLRHERVLTTPADADALIADPLVDAELRAALSVA